MDIMELTELINEYKDRFNRNCFLYVKVFLDDGNLTIDLKEDGNDINLSSNGFLTINNVVFYDIGIIWDIEFH